MLDPNNQVADTWRGIPSPPEAMPAEADVVIIGAGIVGIATAWELAQAGQRVVVCEKGHIAGEQSGRNWGWVRQQGRDSREMPMILDSLSIWRELADNIGEDVGYRQHGVLFAFRNEEDEQSYVEWLEMASAYDVDSRLISAAELAREVRGSTGKWRGAMFTPSDGRAEPQLATAALARAAVRQGAEVLTSCAVRGIETAAGKVAAVITEHGVIRTERVVCAAGAWTSTFCRSLGIDVPQLKVRGTVARLEPGADVLDGDLFDAELAIRRRLDGGYTLANGFVLDHPITPATFRYARKFLPALRLESAGLRISIGREFVEEWRRPVRWALDQPSPFEQTRVLNPRPSDRVVRDIRRNVDKLFPALRDARIVETWAGMIEATPDVVPVIDGPAQLPGFFIATGFSGHGFGIGPGAGRAIARLLLGKDVGYDLHDFRLSRFFDGSPIRPQSSV